VRGHERDIHRGELQAAVLDQCMQLSDFPLRVLKFVRYVGIEGFADDRYQARVSRFGAKKDMRTSF
jgi:hypothetical protein